MENGKRKAAFPRYRRENSRRLSIRFISDNPSKRNSITCPTSQHPKIREDAFPLSSVLDTRAVGDRKMTEIVSGTERKMPGREIATNRGAAAMMPPLRAGTAQKPSRLGRKRARSGQNAVRKTTGTYPKIRRIMAG